jgi:hypothetical protein
MSFMAKHRKTLEAAVMSALIFLAALLPRVISLGTFITADESRWMSRSLNFYDALLHCDWIGTYQTSHPGVVTMWLAGATLTAYQKLASLRLVSWDYNGYLFAGAFPIALAVSVCVLIVFFLLKKLFGRRIAVLGALFIALDPFLISYSRVIHLDALLAMFMTISALLLVVYLNGQEKKSWLVASGVFMGLAILTKRPALFLLPFSALIIVLWRLAGMKSLREAINRENLLAVAKTLLLLMVAGALTFIVLWPSMWIAPRSTLYTMLSSIGDSVSMAHSTPGVFMGEVVSGHYSLLYYPVVILMEMTPWTLVFSVVCLCFLGADLARSRLAGLNKNVLALLAFIIFFTVQMTIGTEAVTRYILPAFPAIDILAAIGLCRFAHFAGEKLGRKAGSSAGLFVLAALSVIVVIAQALMLAQVHPYYLSYYDPVVFGGPARAPDMVSVGWGEGIDRAAVYFNGMPNASDLVVTCQYSEMLTGMFKEKLVGMKNVSDADYVVFYVRYVQIGRDKDILDEFNGTSPEKVITINGIDYCWIYKNKRQDDPGTSP